jgi:cytidyltransferase-like protein
VHASRQTLLRASVLTLVLALSLGIARTAPAAPITTARIDAPRGSGSRLRQALRQASVIGKQGPGNRLVRGCKAITAAACSLLGRRAPVLLYMGTFDPVHAGHLANLKAALAGVPSARRVYVVPTSELPSKTPLPYPHRVAMMRAALRDAGLPSNVEVVVVDDPKLARVSADGFDTLSAMIHSRHPGAPVAIMTGADAFTSAAEGGLVSKALRWGYRYAVTPRAGHALPERLPFGVQIMPESGGRESSTRARAELAAGHAPSDLTPSTLRYIEEHGLYGAGRRP